MSERQTYKYLSAKFEAAGLEPKTNYGQNFLIDMNLLDLIVRTADIQPNDVILEVGTGMGSLTSKMAPLAGHVITVEIDRDMAAMAKSELRDFDNISLLNYDALKNKNHFREELIEKIQAECKLLPVAKLKLVANLPYNVATPIVSNMLSITPMAERMVVTIQKELAERITAPPGVKDYSALSIWIQSQADCEIVRLMSPKVFWPKPRVESAILKICPNAQKRARLVDPEYFHSIVRGIFCHRRKLLRSSLASALPDSFSKAHIDELLSETDFRPDVRAEQLSVEQIIALVDKLRSAAIG